MKIGIDIKILEHYLGYTKSSGGLISISKFLDKIIRPVFNDKCATTTIVDGASLIKEVNKYIKEDLLKPSTLFCTSDIKGKISIIRFF